MATDSYVNPEGTSPAVSVLPTISGKISLGLGSPVRDHRYLQQPVGEKPFRFPTGYGGTSRLTGFEEHDTPFYEMAPYAGGLNDLLATDQWPFANSDWPDYGGYQRPPEGWQPAQAPPGGQPLQVQFNVTKALPKGSIIMWNDATNIPKGWVICNKVSVDAGHPVPNLEGHFIVATGLASNVVGALANAETDQDYALADKGGFSDHGNDGAGVVNNHATHSILTDYNAHTHSVNAASLVAAKATSLDTTHVHEFDDGGGSPMALDDSGGGPTSGTTLPSSHGHTVEAADGSTYVDAVAGADVSVAADVDHDNTENRPRFYALVFICKVVD